MDYKNLTSPCGLDCFNCESFKAKEDIEIRNKIADKLSIPEEKAFCDGCRDEKGAIRLHGYNDACEIYACSEKNGVHNCGECSDFPCDLLYPHLDKASLCSQNIKAFNCLLIKKMGLEEWAKDKAQKVRDIYFKNIL